MEAHSRVQKCNQIFKLETDKEKDKEIYVTKRETEKGEEIYSMKIIKREKKM